MKKEKYYYVIKNSKDEIKYMEFNNEIQNSSGCSYIRIPEKEFILRKISKENYKKYLDENEI